MKKYTLIITAFVSLFFSYNVFALYKIHITNQTSGNLSITGGSYKNERMLYKNKFISPGETGTLSLVSTKVRKGKATITLALQPSLQEFCILRIQRETKNYIDYYGMTIDSGSQLKCTITKETTDNTVSVNVSQ